MATSIDAKRKPRRAALTFTENNEMRHQKSGRILGRNSSHRKAMFRNMAASLFRYEQIRTTVPKAKELRRVAEPLITLAKTSNLANQIGRAHV